MNPKATPAFHIVAWIRLQLHGHGSDCVSRRSYGVFTARKRSCVCRIVGYTHGLTFGIIKARSTTCISLSRILYGKGVDLETHVAA